MHPNDYRKLREAVGERTDVGPMLDVNPKHIAKREQGHQRITREAEFAMRWLAHISRRLKRPTVDKRTETRRAKEWERAYGSVERVEWIAARPCLVCKKVPSENAHAVTGGMSRKANADTVLNLCRNHHRELHRTGRRKFETKYQTGDLLEAARLLNQKWQEEKRERGEQRVATIQQRRTI